MVLGRSLPDLDGLLRRTAASTPAVATDLSNRVPWNAIEVADALLAHRESLQAGGVFPEILVDRLAMQLRS